MVEGVTLFEWFDKSDILIIMMLILNKYLNFEDSLIINAKLKCHQIESTTVSYFPLIFTL